MSVSEKGISFLDPLRDHLDKVELHSHTARLGAHEELEKKMNDESVVSAPQYNLPFVHPPQKRKFLSLATENSADSTSRPHPSPALDAAIKLRRSPAFKEGFKAMDLSAMKSTDELVVSMEGSFVTAQEEVMEKKKLLADLAGMNSNSKALHESFKAFHHDSSKTFRDQNSVLTEHIASNPSRICRFCRREFPSGRALGGHMRVHGALLDAHTSSVNMMKQEKKKQKQDEDGKVRSNFHQRKDMRVPADLSASLELVEREGAGMLSSGERDGASSEERAEVKTSSEGNSENLYDQKPDTDYSAHTHPSPEEETNLHDVLNLSYFDYSSGYQKSGDLQLAAGMDCVEYALSFDSKKHPGLYELRRNPKPNQRFIRERYIAAQMNQLPNANCRSSNPTRVAPLSGSARDQAAPRSTSSSPEREQEHPCSECGKVFVSWKALFGHMRCHPEREWRGIQRPDSSVELDHTARSTTLRQSSIAGPDPTELGYGAACNKSNFIKAEKTKETTQTKEEIVQARTPNLQEDDRTASFPTKRGIVVATSSVMQKGPGTAIDTDCGKFEENKEAAGCTGSKHEAAFMHAHIEEMTDDWSPIWSSAGKRSKRRRLLMAHAQPALTSETDISIEVGFDKNGPDHKDQDDLDMANCLVLLSSAGNMQEINRNMSMESTEESAFSHPDKMPKTLSNVDQWEGLSNASDEAVEDGDVRSPRRFDDDDEAEDDEAENNGSHFAALLPVKYQCSTCKKCFNSHQALGGHRASHRKMKGCFARMKSLTAGGTDGQESSEENDSEEVYFLNNQPTKGQVIKHTFFREGAEEERAYTAASNNPLYKGQMRKKFKGHECSICHRIFATGQALGGHKRCHWTGEKAPPPPPPQGTDTASVASSSTNNKKQESPPIEGAGEWGYKAGGPHKHVKEDVIDLNLPAPLDEEEEVGFDAACGALTCAKLRSLPMQAWNPAKVVPIPQVCSMQTL